MAVHQLSLPVLSILAALSVASGSARAAEVEIGTLRRFGVGVAAGYPPTATAKYYFDKKNGFSAHIGPTLGTSGLHLRIQFEQKAADLAQWDFGELSFTWHIGVVSNFIFGQAVSDTPVRPGINAGVGVELRVNFAPVAFFGELSPVIYPLDLLPGASFLPVGVIFAVGGRWYF